MFTESSILLPTDFSHHALYAQKYAVALARKYGSTVHITHVLDPTLFSVGSGHGFWLTQTDQERLSDSMTRHAEERLAHMSDQFAGEGISVETHILQGKPDIELGRFALEKECGLIVIATHGRTGFDHLVFGSVAERVVRNAQVPCLCIKHPEHDFVDDRDMSMRLGRVLFPTDFSEYTEHALSHAVSLCKQFEATLVLFHATEIPVVLPEFMPDTAAMVSTSIEGSSAEAMERLRGEVEGVAVETEVRTGVPYREICRVVEELEIDLVVLPTHGRGALAQAIFGSVAEKVVRLAPCPVLTVRPDEAG
jgi:nucleotide-binding universal stress UspA family protein